MLASFAWGFAAAATLIAGAAFALRRGVAPQTLGMIMAFGERRVDQRGFVRTRRGGLRPGAPAGAVALGLCAGSVTFAGDSFVDRIGGADRKDSDGKQAEGTALAIVRGIVLDGIPEPLVLGLTIVVGGSVSAAFLVAVALSNIPEGIAATAGLARAG